LPFPLAHPLARVVSDSNALLLVYLGVLVCVAIATFRNHRLHAVFAWGAPLLIASQQLAELGAHTQAWREFVTRLFA